MTTRTPEAIKNLKWVGLLLIVLGVVSIAAPALAGGFVVLVVGAVLVAAGVFQVVRGLKSEAWSEKLLATIMGVISSIAGLLVIGHPLLGLSFLTLLLVAYFVAEGAWKIAVSFSYRPATGWVWLLLSGVLSLVLGWLIFSQWPVSGLWAVGVLVGVNLLGSGVALMTLSRTIRSATGRG